ncbi:hypothetical protein RJT34_30999 [Clitoria ternatea]|uniref:Uncharacterized protein n=1 Tax=Clitoria ternatea TaxID=43366 RepID=A0AAN9I4L2_CLITE
MGSSSLRINHGVKRMVGCLCCTCFISFVAIFEVLVNVHHIMFHFFPFVKSFLLSVYGFSVVVTLYRL